LHKPYLPCVPKEWRVACTSSAINVAESEGRNLKMMAT
jgi:hypothetical protein